MKNLNSIKRVIEEKYIFFFLGVIALTCFNVFFNLNNISITDWDEARHGISAYEMIKNNNFIVNTYMYKNDYWNLKPPVSFWAIILGFKIFGYNLLGFRFFSALSAILTIIMVGFYTKYRHGKFCSIVSMILLSTTPQYIVSHSARRGDADSIFVLFFTIAIISILLIKDNIKWLYVAGLSFSLAFLTKSWHAGLIALIGGTYLIVTKQILKFTVKQWMIFLLTSFLPIGIWFITRYSQDGLTFVEKMVEYDLLARTSTALEGNKGGRFFYFQTLLKYCPNWVLIITLFIPVLLFVSKRKIKFNDEVLGLIIWILLSFIMFTIAKTKLPWYILPIYPAMAILFSIMVNSLFNVLNNVNLIVAIIVLAVTLGQGITTYKIIKLDVDEGQEILRNTKNVKEIQGYKIYNIEQWNQRYAMAAEIYGQLVPCEGSIEEFLKDEKALVIAPKSTNTKEKYKLNIVLETTNQYILRK